MKPSHLAALCLAGLGVGGMSSAAVASQVIESTVPSSKNAVVSHQAALEAAMQLDLRRGGFPIIQHPCSFRKKNQRQVRLARRRKHAAGFKRAFA